MALFVIALLVICSQALTKPDIAKNRRRFIVGIDGRFSARKVTADSAAMPVFDAHSANCSLFDVALGPMAGIIRGLERSTIDTKFRNTKWPSRITKSKKLTTGNARQAPRLVKPNEKGCACHNGSSRQGDRMAGLASGWT